MRSTANRILLGVQVGLALAVVYSVIAIVVNAAVGTDSTSLPASGLARIVGAYFLGGVLAGGLVGALRPWMRSVFGAAVVGFLAALIVMYGLALALKPLVSPGELSTGAIAIIAAILLGPALGIRWREELSGDD